MSRPNLGDLVLEITVPQARAMERLGRLLWVDHEGGDPARDVWTIQTLEGQEIRWHNARFIVVPEDQWRHQGAGAEGDM
jgi:hypothetical protein